MDENIKRYNPEAFKCALELIEKSSSPNMRIIVPERMGKLHPFVENTKIEFDLKKEKWNNGKILTINDDVFFLNIGPKSISRSLLILNALCKSFTKNNFPIVARGKYIHQYKHNFACVEIMGEHIYFSIIETATANKNGPPRFIPTGYLSLRLEEAPPQIKCRSIWKDTKTKTIEQQINNVVKGIILFAAFKKEERAYYHSLNEKTYIKARIETAKEENKAKERLRIKAFNDDLKNWELYNKMKLYLEKVKATYGLKNTSNDGYQKWVSWAVEYIESINPLNKKEPKYDIRQL
ncbi:MAG: hypothetical protein GY793_08985 [Proteobacteria bacterium]|nr:hypothetical protein [Pseudomonadota bacterium]